MDIEIYRDYCLSKKGVTESFPFDEEVLAFKVMNKIFALGSVLAKPLAVNLKCDPEKSVELREATEKVIFCIMIVQQQVLQLSEYSFLYDLIVPKENLLRKINDLIDFSFINEELQTKYSQKGRVAECSIKLF